MELTCEKLAPPPSVSEYRSSLPLGVCVVICCHNGGKRLARTLAHLADQVVPPEIAWEVIVVDNASTDGTADVAAACWSNCVPLRIISEPRLGLTYARERGFREAKYEFISFVDDDNWVSPEWVRTVFRLMCDHPDVGI